MSAHETNRKPKRNTVHMLPSGWAVLRTIAIVVIAEHHGAHSPNANAQRNNLKEADCGDIVQFGD